MATHKIFEGGNRSNRVTNQMLPSGTSPAACNSPYSYADHQRERSYGVTRRLDLRARVPYGGGGKGQSLVCYFKDNPIGQGDDLETHLLLPNTVLFGVSFGIINPLPGLQFSLRVKNAGVNVISNVDAGVIPRNSTNCPLSVWRPVPSTGPYAAPGGLFIDEEDFLTLDVDALPADGLLPGCGDGGLNMWITAHVLDLDHGNA
jgi:hypothetical protein